MLTIFYRNFTPTKFYRSLTSASINSGSFENDKTENIDINNESNPFNETQFAKEFFANRIQTTEFQKAFLSVGSSIASLINPRRHEMIACLGETTGHNALLNMLNQMRSTEEGCRILKDVPRINTKTVDLKALEQLDENKFGYHYFKFLKDNKVTPDSRMAVRFMDDPELAYVMTRYRETHDLVHTILGMPTNMLGEVAVKWIEAINTGLPMCYGGAVFGAIRLRPKQRKLYSNHILPWAITVGKELKPLISVYWEERWNQDIEELRKELNITTINIFNK